jgi:hypothetical protein
VKKWEKRKKDKRKKNEKKDIGSQPLKVQMFGESAIACCVGDSGLVFSNLALFAYILFKPPDATKKKRKRKRMRKKRRRTTRGNKNKKEKHIRSFF